MSNVGQTIITARGDDEEIARLRQEIEASVIGGRTFSIARLSRGDTARERYVLWSDIIEEAEPICLSVGIIHDLDCLFLAEDLAARFPSLTVTGWFSAEGSIPDVRILSFRGTTQLYDVAFDGPWFSLPAPGDRGDRYAVCFYQRSPEAVLAAAEYHGGAGLRRIAAVAPRHADWHRGDDGYGEGFFFRPPRAGDDGGPCCSMAARSPGCMRSISPGGTGRRRKYPWSNWRRGHPISSRRSNTGFASRLGARPRFKPACRPRPRMTKSRFSDRNRGRGAPIMRYFHREVSARLASTFISPSARIG